MPCAATGEDTSIAANVPATGIAHMIRAANKPPRTRIPTFMRNAPLLFRCRIAPLRAGRFPFVAPLVANFAGAANVLLQCNFIFIPRRCLSATYPNTNLLASSEQALQPRHLMEIVVE